MKTYVKPTMEVIELRPEERLAHCGQSRMEGKTYWDMIFSWVFGRKHHKCRLVFKNSSCPS